MSSNPEQKELINKLLSVDFPGVKELRSQLVNADLGRPSSNGTFDIYVKDRDLVARVDSPIPVEGLIQLPDGNSIEYLLHVIDGYMVELEVIEYSSPNQSLTHKDVMEKIIIMNSEQRKQYEITGRTAGL